MKKLSKIIVIFLIVTGFAIPAVAQAPDSGQQGAQGRVQRGTFDPAQMQQMMSERFKETLELNDEEWQVIGPKVIKVLEMSFQQRGNPIRMFGGRQGMQGMQGPPGQPGQQGQRQFTQRRNNSAFPSGAGDETMQQLQKLLENKNASTAEIKNLVTKVRKEREKMEQEKMTAQKELRELLTVRQEAILISMGLLD